jgi:hypothetical protein
VTLCLHIALSHICKRYAANSDATIESIVSLLRSSQAVSARANIHLARFSHSPEHYPVNVRPSPAFFHNPFSSNSYLSYQALRNAAAAFASTQWVLNLDADFIPTVETHAALRAAIQSHGHSADGRPLKRAFVVPPFSAQHAVTLPLNFSFISANLGDTASHAINSWPEVPAHPGDERQYQCHANIDLQRWRLLSQQTASGTAALSTALYKVA